MITEIDYRTTEIGEVLNYRELIGRCRTVWGGVAWPGKRPGFVVVLAMDIKPHFKSHDIFLLDEFESFDTRELVRQLGAMDIKYGIMNSKIYIQDSMDRWIGDYMNEAASRFILTMNKEHKRTNCQMSLSSTMMLEMLNLYSFILPQIKELLMPERRQLFIKDSKIISYLSEIEETEINDFKLGEYPAIEAIGFTVIEMRKQAESRERMLSVPKGSVWGGEKHLLDFGREVSSPWT